MTDETKKTHRRVTLVENHGSSIEQKDRLVESIISTFESPEHWPLTDEERCAVLRSWYRCAKTAAETEQVGG